MAAKVILLHRSLFIFKELVYHSAHSVCSVTIFQIKLTKLKQFSIIVLLNLDRSLDLSQQWQFSILSSMKIVFYQKHSGPKKYASNYSSEKNS